MATEETAESRGLMLAALKLDVASDDFLNLIDLGEEPTAAELNAARQAIHLACAEYLATVDTIYHAVKDRNKE